MLHLDLLSQLLTPFTGVRMRDGMGQDMIPKTDEKFSRDDPGTHCGLDVLTIVNVSTSFIYTRPNGEVPLDRCVTYSTYPRLTSPSTSSTHKSNSSNRAPKRLETSKPHVQNKLTRRNHPQTINTLHSPIRQTDPKLPPSWQVDGNDVLLQPLATATLILCARYARKTTWILETTTQY
jgi:hypothetical protein